MTENKQENAETLYFPNNQKYAHNCLLYVHKLQEFISYKLQFEKKTTSKGNNYIFNNIKYIKSISLRRSLNVN